MVVIPRDVSSKKLVSVLTKLGYSPIHQSGSHIKLVTHTGGRNIAIVPVSKAIPVGTLSSILKGIARHRGISVKELIEYLGI